MLLDDSVEEILDPEIKAHVRTKMDSMLKRRLEEKKANYDKSVLAHSLQEIKKTNKVL